MIKTGWIAALAVGLALTMTQTDVDARRLGGGKSTGMQRATPDKAAQGTPATPAAAPNNAAAPAAAAAPNAAAAAQAAAPRRSWLGPIAGLAAGLGLAALFSHLGMGEELANFMMLALLAIAAIFVVRWLIGRFAGNRPAARREQFAMAGGHGASAGPGASDAFAPPLARPSSPVMAREALPAQGASVPVAAAVSGLALPAGFDHAAFERIAKMIFIRLQAAHDAGDLDDLRAFTTPEMFASARLDLQERGGVAQKTDVVTVDARLIDFAQEAERQIVSVRYSGLIREESEAAAASFDEVWHLVRPLDGSREWAIAGIQQEA
jgi:predicted lipid-binding transport protein (Tim44 family)